MHTKDLYKALNYLDHTREKRSKMAKEVLQAPALIKPLLDIALKNDNPISSRACWVLEFACKERISILFPYIAQFIHAIDKVNLHASVRPMAKICECLVISYFVEQRKETREALIPSFLEQITTTAFDWLIGDHKVAVKAYSMTCLYCLGQHSNWVHPELKLILQKNYPKGSAAYKARARHVLSQIK